MDLLEYYRRRGKLVRLDETDDEISQRMIRASGLVVCDECGKLYYDHPYIENLLDFNDRPFLHLTCDGVVIKL